MKRCWPWAHEWRIGEWTEPNYFYSPLVVERRHWKRCAKCGKETITSRVEEWKLEEKK